MEGRAFRTLSRRIRRWTAVAVFLTATWSGGYAAAQTSTAPAAPGKLTMAAETPAEPVPGVLPSGSGVVQAGCNSCGGGLLGASGGGDTSTIGSGGCGTCCVPGRTFCCDCCNSDTFVGRMVCGL